MTNPYAGKPDYHFWRRVVSGRDPMHIDPVVRVPFTITKAAKVATAGSCFAQHIARFLKETGFNYFVPEDGPTLASAVSENYGVFSARFGNIYTVRQLWQLFQRAYGLFAPVEQPWKRSDGRYVDPFRPRIQAHGFAQIADLLADRDHHLGTVRQMFEECDVFVFTLGLTEGWMSSVDGAVFPLAPGTVAPINSNNYAFHNFTVHEMEADLHQFIRALKSVNPRCNVLLTVSPVPLIATYEDEHVLTATTLSKSALRVVAGAAERTFNHVGYFPSFEIIAGPQARGVFFEDDLREVRPEGVAHVMSIFGRHYLSEQPQHNMADVASPSSSKLMGDQAETMRALQAVICDEEEIERSL